MKYFGLFLLSVILLFPFDIVEAQNNSQYNYAIEVNYSNYIDYHGFRYVPSMKGKKINYEVVHQKQNKIEKFERTYNKEGQLLEYFRIEGDNKVPILRNEFTAKGRYSNRKKYKKGVLHKQTSYSYNEDDQLTEMYESQKGKEISRKYWNHNDDKCIESSTWYKKGKLKRKWAYEYYSECDRKKSTLFKANGKVVNEWNYDCKSEGEIVEPKKDVTQVCKWEEADSTTIKYISQTIDEKGRARKTVYIHRRSDTALVSKTEYDHKDRLESEIFFDPNYEHRWISDKTYNSKGEVIWSNEFIYNDDLLIKEIRKSGKWFRSIEYNYNQNNEMAGIDFHKKSEGNIYRKIAINYNN